MCLMVVIQWVHVKVCVWITDTYSILGTGRMEMSLVLVGTDGRREGRGEEGRGEEGGLGEGVWLSSTDGDWDWRMSFTCACRGSHDDHVTVPGTVP